MAACMGCTCIHSMDWTTGLPLLPRKWKCLTIDYTKDYRSNVGHHTWCPQSSARLCGKGSIGNKSPKSHNYTGKVNLCEVFLSQRGTIYFNNMWIWEEAPYLTFWPAAYTVEPV